MDCTFALLRYRMREELADCSNPGDIAECQLGNDPTALVLWLYRLRSGSDMDFSPSLLKLYMLEQQSILVDRKGEGHNSPMIEYKALKADLVGQACMRFCREVLCRDFGDVVVRMSQEKEGYGV